LLDQQLISAIELCRSALQQPGFVPVHKMLHTSNAFEILREVADDASSRLDLLKLPNLVGSDVGSVSPRTLSRYLLLRSAESALPLVAALPVDDAIKSLIYREFEFFATPGRGFEALFDLTNYSFTAMAKIATLRRFPAGQLDWEVSGLPRSWLLKVPRKKVPGLLNFVVVHMKGFSPAFFTHVARHRPGRLVVLEKEFKKSYYRIVKSMELQPAVKGILSSSWFYSPEIGRVSPHLDWMPRFFERNGGWVSTMGTAPHNSGVFSRSPERMKSFEDKEFTPKLGLVLWPRRAALEWTRRHEELNS
jgi:hypothetical protein